jgi:hypothetical protein
MITGDKKFRAALVVGALTLSLYSSVTLGETVLDGAAGIIGASIGIVVPAIQAAAEKSIAATNSAASIYMNTLAAQTQAYGIGASTMTSMYNTLATLRIASMNNQNSLEQTYLATAFQAWDRNLNYQLRREQMYADNYFKNKEFELKMMMARAEQYNQLAQFEADRQAKGLSNGLQPIRTISSLSLSNVNNSNDLSVVPDFRPLSTDPRAWSAPKALAFKAKALGRAFSELSGLAGGSTREKKQKSDIDWLLVSKPASESLDLHRSFRPIRAEEGTHRETR